MAQDRVTYAVSALILKRSVLTEKIVGGQKWTKQSYLRAAGGGRSFGRFRNVKDFPKGKWPKKCAPP
jgi:hypothetical protein